MFFRMLKKDLADKKRLNIILLIFMCLASVLTVCSAIMLYTNIFGIKADREKVNAADVVIINSRDLGGIEEKQKKLSEWFLNRDGVTELELGETISFRQNAVDFEGFEEDSQALLKDAKYFAYDLNMKHNRVTDMNSQFFDLDYGTIAVPQIIHKYAGVNIGDTVRITTQLGNIYEFKVTVITKDPGMNGHLRLFFNEEDYEVLKKDSPIIEDVYMVKLFEGNTYLDQSSLVNDFSEMKESEAEYIRGYKLDDSYTDQEVSSTLTALMIVFSVLLILMVFMTISFTIKSAIKNEEKELGMLKALGIESMSFNWLFAAKYIAISLFSSIVGFFGGIYFSRYEIKYLTFGYLEPELGTMIPVALITSLMSFIIIVFFVAIGLRRMKRISIIDVIAGENRGERFGKHPGLFLHKMKKINVPFYLALTDLTNRIKRYKFLIFAYTFGIAIIITLLEIYNTVYSSYWIERMWGRPEFDFVLDMSREMSDEYIQRGGSLGGAIDIVNEELREATIPATVGYCSYVTDIELKHNNEIHMAGMYFDCDYISDFELYEGVHPKLRNEVLMDAIDAKKSAIEVGDSISVKYYKYNDDGLTYKEVEEEFIVVGLVDVAEGQLSIYTSDMFEGAAEAGRMIVGSKIDAPDSMKDEYIEQMREMYGQSSIRNKIEEIDYSLSGYGAVYSTILMLFIPMILILMIMVTVLYQSVNMVDETPDIALLKCGGFTNGNVKAWQLIRSTMISIGSSILAILLVNTAIAFGLKKLFFNLGYILNYHSNQDVFRFYIVLPILITVIIDFITYLTLKRVDDMEISKIRDI
ncbi:ABC-type transport system, involved in lipoprotein release, permease component [Pseudobutyrivibrio sp. AR14]|nr:ABC-type transport system, involved in lipoprotein release, permease component [Pseudobutyrivibrio sp. AR14]